MGRGLRYISHAKIFFIISSLKKEFSIEASPSQSDAAADIPSRMMGALCEALLADGDTGSQPWLGSQLVNLLQVTALISRAIKQRRIFVSPRDICVIATSVYGFHLDAVTASVVL